MSDSTTTTPLRGWMLILARSLWLALALPAAAIVLYGLYSSFTGWWNFGFIYCPLEDAEAYAACLADSYAMQAFGMTARFNAVYFTTGLGIQVLPWILVGGLIFWRRSRVPFGLGFSLMMVLTGALLLDNAFEIYFSKGFPQLQMLVPFLGNIGSALMVVWYRFPAGRFAPQWMKAVAALWLVIRFINYFFNGSPLDVYFWPNPLPLIIDALFIASILGSVIYRYFALSTPIEQQQIKWVVVFGALFGLFFIYQTFTPPPDHGRQMVIFSLTELPLRYLTSALFAGSLGLAILRRHLWDIDVIIRRTLTYSLLTGALGLVYLICVVGLQALSNALIGRNPSDWVTVLSTLASAALFTPLRRRIQSTIDRSFYRRKYDVERSLAELNRTLRDEVDLAVLSQRLLNEVTETMQPEQVSLWLRHPPEPK